MKMPRGHKANFIASVRGLMETLVLAERYEAVSPVSRMAQIVFEKHNEFKELSSMLVDVQNALNRAHEIKLSGKRHLGTYFRVIFYGVHHFGEEHRSEWVYREPGVTSLAEACERMVEAVRNALGHDHVEVIPENQVDVDKLKTSVAYVQMTHVEPCLVDPRNPSIVPVSDPMNYDAHTNNDRFVYEEPILDETVPKNAPEQAKLSLRRVYLRVAESFPNTRRRQRVVDRFERVLNPLELACDSLRFKAAQIRKILSAAGIFKGHGFDKSALHRLDLKGLQLLLQGSVSPTVNVGVLAYAEAFTMPSQQERYGADGRQKLVDAFKELMTELNESLKVNEAAIGADQAEYQCMLKNSFDGMKERLSSFFGGENFIIEPSKAKGSDGDGPELGPRTSMHVLDSISGVNR
ncbi:Dedicator of cytokinesis family protein [Aphelenchoides avenae]|nr:Dedicator of cytokinesis family protein [Aphelenchus avenae]